VIDCNATGAIPKELNGAFYRLHGDWIYPPKFPDDASLAADGYISMFRFRDGSVDYRDVTSAPTVTIGSTPRAAAALWLLSQSLYRRSGGARYRPSGRRTAANTTPVILAGKLYATKEEGLPYAIDPNTLETLGPTDFDGAWKSQTFTAHPKLDPATARPLHLLRGDRPREQGRLPLFIRPGGPDRLGSAVEVPYPSMLHDMALSKDYVVIPGGGTVTSEERLASGRPHWAWDSKRPSYYAVIPRGGAASDIRWFEGPERSIVHTANAWNNGEVLTMDAPAADGNTWPWFEDVHGAPFTMHIFTIRRFTFDLRGNSPQPREELLFGHDVTSFTRIDERLATTPNRLSSCNTPMPIGRLTPNCR